jgi:hypothetical protein
MVKKNPTIFSIIKISPTVSFFGWKADVAEGGPLFE